MISLMMMQRDGRTDGRTNTIILSPRSGFSKSGAFTVGALGAVHGPTPPTLPWLFESQKKYVPTKIFFKFQGLANP